MDKRMATDAIDRALTPDSFQRRGTRWYRSAGDVTDVVALIAAKSGQLVTVELGVFDPRVLEPISAPPKTVTEADCMVRQDLALLAGRADMWDPENPDDAARIHRLMSEDGLRWLDAMHSADARIGWLRERAAIPSEVAMLAIAEALSGTAHQHDIDSRLSGNESRVHGR